MPHDERCVITLDRHVTRGFSDEFSSRLCVYRNFGNSTRDWEWRSDKLELLA